MTEKFAAPNVPHPHYKPSDVTALQALSAGTATAEQQKAALKWIIEGACGMYTWAYTEDERATCIALGRQLAGQEIVGLLKLKLSELRSE